MPDSCAGREGSGRDKMREEAALFVVTSFLTRLVSQAPKQLLLLHVFDPLNAWCALYGIEVSSVKYFQCISVIFTFCLFAFCSCPHAKEDAAMLSQLTFKHPFAHLEHVIDVLCK